MLKDTDHSSVMLFITVGVMLHPVVALEYSVTLTP